MAMVHLMVHLLSPKSTLRVPLQCEVGWMVYVPPGACAYFGCVCGRALSSTLKF